MTRNSPGQQLPVFAAAFLLLALTAITACTDEGQKSTAATTQNGGSTQQPASGSAVISWSAPTENTNGTALTDLAGYTIRYGASPSELTQSISVNSAAASSYTVSGLAAGTWYFSVVANTNTGVESAPTTPVSTTIS